MTQENVPQPADSPAMKARTEFRLPNTPAFQGAAYWHRILRDETKIPTLLIGRMKVKAGAYIPDKQQILLSVHSEDPLSGLIHQFAHAVDFARGGRSHEESFYQSLREIVRRVYASAGAYRWQDECMRIQKWALRDGIIDKLPELPPAEKPASSWASVSDLRRERLCNTILPAQREESILSKPEYGEVLTWFQILNQEYGLEVRLAGSPTRVSQYDSGRNRIVIGARCKTPLKTLIHEFAHAVNHSRGGKHHGAAFYVCLREVAKRVLGSEDRYDWSHEYATLMKMAHRDGLLKEMPTGSRRSMRKEMNEQFRQLLARD